MTESHIQQIHTSINSCSLENVRVLVIFGGIPLHGQERGNIEVFRALKEFNIKTRFITHEEWGHLNVQPELTHLGFDWTTAPFGPLMGRNILGLDFFRVLWGVVRTNWVLWREIWRWRPTHIHCMNWLYILYASPTLFLLRTPLVYRLGDCPPCSTFLHRWLWRMICRRASTMVCNSNFVKKQLEESGGRPGITSVIHNKVPSRGDISETIPNGDGITGPTLIYVGQLTVEKGIPVLIEAASRCLAAGLDFRLILVGDYSWKNPMAQALMQKVRSNGLAERIQFLGYQKNVPALLRSSDLHVCPSIWGEPFANVVMEAKAAGIPSIIFPDGGLPEAVVHQVDGYICREKSVEALIEGIEWFLNRPEERKRAGKAALQSLRDRFGPEQFQKKWAEVFLGTSTE